MRLYITFLPPLPQFLELIVALFPKTPFKNALVLLKSHSPPSSPRAPLHVPAMGDCISQCNSSQQKAGV